MAKELTPKTRLAVEGWPFIAAEPNGEPKLGVVCTDLKIAQPLTYFAWSFAQTRLVSVWVAIFGLIVVLQALLPRLMPPGLLPLAILLVAMRLAEGASFMPDGLRAFLRGWMVKILILAALVIAVWFFVQYGYYTTPRFR